MIAKVGAPKAGENAGGDGDGEHPVKTVAEKIGGGAGSNQHGDHQNNAHGLQAHHGGEGEEREESVV
jgi:hypothetical protein